MKAGWIAGLALLAGATATTQAQAPKGRPPLDRSLLQMQVILDHLGFSPGVLDGRAGISLTAALKGFQTSRGLPATGKPDPATVQALNRYKAWAPTRTLKMTREALAGPYFNPFPKGEDQQAKLPALGYRSPMEKLAEMFHTTPRVLMELNGPDTKLAPGAKVVFPNALPLSRDYAADLKPEWRQTLSMLNVSAQQPQAARIVVDKSDKVLRAYDAAGKLVAQFMVTTGSGHDPLPLGTWKINVVDTNPKFHYNPALFWDASKGDQKAMLPPGPNGPVGVVWIDLSKEHYGIHGTPEPQNIGRTESHGCVRLTNWDAARLALMVKAGRTAVVFQA